MAGLTNFRYLNIEDNRALFTLSGLKWQDGVLTLNPVPAFEAVVTEALTPSAVFGGPAGIGIDTDGNLYIADTAGNRVLRYEACTGEVEPLPCFGGEGGLPGQLRQPRGVIVGPHNRLYVADSGNHRVQVVDIATLQLVGVWGQADPATGDPQPGDAPGQFDQPWNLASDSAGFVYVACHGNRRVQKFDAGGQVMADFWETLQSQSPAPDGPAYVAVIVLDDGGERLLVMADNGLLMYHTDGVFDEGTTQLWAALLAGHSVGDVAGIVFIGDALYVADAASGRLLVFDREGGFAGVARGYRGPIASLMMDRRGRLLLHTGSALLRLQPGQAYGETGEFLAGPFDVGDQPTGWHRLRAQVDGLSEAAHLRLFTRTSMSPASPSLPGDDFVSPDDERLAPLNAWRAAPSDADDLLVLNEPARYLWIAGRLQGDGTSTPVLSRLLVNHDPETWLRYLPNIYQGGDMSTSENPAGEAVFLERTLALFESLLGDSEALIDHLPRLFDPAAAPDEPGGASWLDWLAGWLDFELDETWNEPHRREALAQAFALYARRGTADSLRELLALYTGADVRIEEPSQYINLWSLGENSTLGFTTMLAPAYAEGAVLDTTATLDGSHLIDERDYGAPLFEGSAHHFCVQLHAASAPDPQTVERVRQIIEREKPAHTTYHLCLLAPRMRVGFQARIGVDTIVGGGLNGPVIGGDSPLGRESVLPADDRPPAIGRDARVGRRGRMS